ncbi:FAD binding domain-containing protein [Cystobasidium minutum MCA 4210]|uniref:FAD binding domain-containing protein n=1 Tax=Cystobasidium minutum MCA 4210 TaxID=1397322 RepID=UPI0034CD8DA4|eukprot:jgi/Rhomi1/202200/MIX3029_6_35
MSTPIVYDVVCIGAGPCGLAVAARLCEHTPSALFTDDEHQRFHWIKKHTGKIDVLNRKNGKISTVKRATCEGRPKINTLVLDSTADQWMQRWNTLFKTFDIKHLRSPMFFHVDPADRDSLLQQAHANGKSDELVQITGCVGKEVSKHQRKKKIKTKRPASEANINEREQEDYYTPSTRLFEEHCRCIIDRYKLKEGLVKKASVLDIQYGDRPELSQDYPLFTLKTDQGTFYARTAVLAVGPANAPALPKEVSSSSSNQLEGQLHSMKIQEFPATSVQAKMAAGRVTNVLVVGGGLTSAQLSDLAIRRGVTKVWHFMRGPCKVKPFDVDLSWMGKWRNVQQAAFWLADTDEERLELIKQARGGGSITTPYNKILQKHIADGKLSLHTHTTIFKKAYDPASAQWHVEADPPIPNLPPMDFVYYATGVQTDFETLPFLQTLLKTHPIHGHGGLPCLTNDLTWREDVPLFVTGRLASLRLGPGGGNLGGARIGAERIAWSIMDHLQNHNDGLDGYVDSDEEKLDYASGRSNRYSRLVEE